MSDEELTFRVWTGCKQSFNELYRRHWEGVTRHLNRAYPSLQTSDQVEDGVQEVFIRLMKPYNANDAWRLHAYLYTLANQAAVWFLRKEYGRRKHRNISLSELAPDHDALAVTPVEHEEITPAIRKKIQELPVKERDAFISIYLHGRTVKEVAQESGINWKTLYRKLKVVRSRLQAVGTT